ncbi:unnamed protein product [Vitrella brassicaformis CCMP3155]|uniref:Uncharacterized protein n=1 Tax=Vitrella brassicaformis (strain CCMP3155) TaxID=1169540 RepID=A0A0G4EA34_VITBC|nr:unnamed protein product [Vitrella brassicaformis CCMP3155]|eukprot:CEL92315.1 unnamed protein product [Vitrella brassicaformis CCMP3155]
MAGVRTQVIAERRKYRMRLAIAVALLAGCFAAIFASVPLAKSTEILGLVISSLSGAPAFATVLQEGICPYQ